MPKVLPEYLELRRQQILDAAASCFSHRGFHPTTMQDICKEAELSPGAVYRYFPSKESIIQAMCERGGNRNVEAIHAALQRENTLDVLNALIDTFFLGLETLHSHSECALNVELIAEAPRNEHIREWLTRNLNEARSMFLDLMRAGQAKGEIDPSLDVASIAQVMVALYHGFITQKLVDPDMDVAMYAGVLRSLFGGTFYREPSSLSGDAATTPAASPALRH
jgi:TetR/AcrR family transcriptional regulator, repressor for uid operon